MFNLEPREERFLGFAFGRLALLGRAAFAAVLRASRADGLGVAAAATGAAGFAGFAVFLGVLLAVFTGRLGVLAAVLAAVVATGRLAALGGFGRMTTVMFLGGSRLLKRMTTTV